MEILITANISLELKRGHMTARSMLANHRQR